ncbi:MAG TPA: cytochrome P450 [Pseudonocardiaceae bacterium]|nr:cytochrome P450 [Pseudonocardiaceae bacterium]
MTELPTLPFDRPDLLTVAPKMRELQVEAPITRVKMETGDEAWLVTRYDDVKTLFADARLGRSHPNPEQAPRFSESAMLGGPMNNFETEAEDHARMRNLLVPRFSPRRMRMLKPKVEGMVDDLLDAMAEHGKPADLHESLAFPLPVLVICELLGVPFDDRAYFRDLSTGMADLYDRRRSFAARQEMYGYMYELVQRKRKEPGNDVLTELTQIEDIELDDQEIAELGSGVLFAGHETTVVRIGMGTLLLLDHPEQLALLRAEPGRLATTVEEILRLGTFHDGPGMPRYASADIEFNGVTIARGDAVILGIGAANRDESVFPDPEHLDLRRDHPTNHLSFGHGARYCIGAVLARIELTAVFERLFTRFPELRLAVPVGELRWRSQLLTGGFERLPVTW